MINLILSIFFISFLFSNNQNSIYFFSKSSQTFSLSNVHYLTIPYNSILPYQTTGSVSETIKPIQGDGGARLTVNDRLYELVNDKSKKSLKTNWARIWR